MLNECRFFSKFFTENSGWTLPALFSILRDLRDLAFDVKPCRIFPKSFLKNCDRQIIMPSIMAKRVNAWRKLQELSQKHSETVWLTGICQSTDPSYSAYPAIRISPPDQSRKWGVYYVVGLVLKCYFRASASFPRVVLCSTPCSYTGQANIAL